ncbi:MAG: 2'-5' RNA ligase [Deltaproteobacteria bacterium CG2_30_63_29]|nr:MAG: 2'-5' RNA ligase [Deltaproteobacteria bacterium CG2_30_63_29]
MTGTKRVFAGIEIDLRVCEKLVLVQEDLQGLIRQRLGKVTWVRPQNLHVTLKFVGEVEASLVERLQGAVATTAGKVEPFSFKTSGVGAFPEGNRPRILYSPITEGVDELVSLARGLDEAFSELGIAREAKDFVPHITLGRVKTPQVRIEMTDVVAALSELPLGTTMVRDVVLFESLLGPRGVRYEVLGRHTLAGVTLERAGD